MPEPGTYLLSQAGWSKGEQAYISLQRGDTFFDLLPVGKTLTLCFDTGQRHCIGWGDITTGERFVCPEHTPLDDKYEQCATCQKRTGFNPAFYHATSVSAQQEKRNSQPHTLYLAHFGSGIVKVGISLADRGRSRLLEQGARSALVLDTFPSALIARQYEAQIAQLPGIVETMQLRKKIIAMTRPYDVAAAETELVEVRRQLEKTIGISLANNAVMTLDSLYFNGVSPAFGDGIDCSERALISGRSVGMLGTILWCAQDDAMLYLPLKKYIGYNVTLSYDAVPIELPPRQTSLF
jgi:hypothetical protein